MLLNGKRRFVTLLPEGDNVRGGGVSGKPVFKNSCFNEKGE